MLMPPRISADRDRDQQQNRPPNARFPLQPQPERDDSEQALGNEQDLATGVPIGDQTTDHRERNRRDQRHEARNTDPCHRFRGFKNHVRNGQILHPRTDARDERRNPKSPEIPVFKGFSGCCHRLGHCHVQVIVVAAAAENFSKFFSANRWKRAEEVQAMCNQETAAHKGRPE